MQLNIGNNIVFSIIIPANYDEGTIIIDILDTIDSSNQDITFIVKIIDTGNIGGGPNSTYTVTIKHPAP